MPKEAVVNGDVHYLADKCGGESVNEVIAGNFINLFKNSPFGMAGGCNGKCTIDNVGVECGNQTEARRRRDAPDGKQASLDTSGPGMELNQMIVRYLQSRR